MSEATLTSKGRVTIPAEIRRLLSLKSRDRVTFTPMLNGTVVLRAKTKSKLDTKGVLQPERGASVSVEDMRMDDD